MSGGRVSFFGFRVVGFRDLWCRLRVPNLLRDPWPESRCGQFGGQGYP